MDVRVEAPHAVRALDSAPALVPVTVLVAVDAFLVRAFGGKQDVPAIAEREAGRKRTRIVLAIAAVGDPALDRKSVV